MVCGILLLLLLLFMRLLFLLLSLLLLLLLLLCPAWPPLLLPPLPWRCCSARQPGCTELRGNTHTCKDSKRSIASIASYATCQCIIVQVRHEH
jgi:hypothetical protein